jgi:uncharacterized protein (TIGR00251 family)
VSGPSIRLRLRVSPGASRSQIVGRHGDGWKVRVGAPAESGKANKALLDLLAATLEIPRNRIEIVAGTVSRDKSIVVHGLSEADVEAKLIAPIGVA